MSQLRIFSYLPNPRIAKATIVARLCGVSVDLRGAPPQDMQDWLWDFDARPMTADERASLQHPAQAGKTGLTRRLYKTAAFLEAHPFGTVPAAFSPDGSVGIFESNSIMRAVARLGESRMQLYGSDPYTASRIDSFLDASLLFARDTQIYVLALWAGSMTADIHVSARQAFMTYVSGIERALARGDGYLVGASLSLADICFVAEMSLFHNEDAHRELLGQAGLLPILSQAIEVQFPLAFEHFARLRAHEAIAPDIEPYLQAIAPRSP